MNIRMYEYTNIRIYEYTNIYIHMYVCMYVYLYKYNIDDIDDSRAYLISYFEEQSEFIVK